MLKLFAFCVLLWHGACEISGLPVDTPAEPLSFSSAMPSIINDTDRHIQLPGNPSFYATHQIFYLNDRSNGRASISSNLKNIGRELNSDYIVTDGIGAHKLHRRKVTWNKARQICIEEGGHLAVIRSDLEEMFLRRMMTNESVDWAWIGFHDTFETGNWVSVLDEPLGATGWARWSKNSDVEPDNTGRKCAFLYDSGGMSDGTCDFPKSFICKISII